MNIIFLLLPFFIVHGQITEPVHLSYNLKKECFLQKKVHDENGVLHFYIQNQHFKSISNDTTLKDFNIKKLNKNQILNISDFLELADKERQKLIKKGEKNKIINILFNNQVFHKIYLYVKDKNNLIRRYLVSWVEEIE